MTGYIMITGLEVKAVCLDCGAILTLMHELLRIRAGKISSDELAFLPRS